MTFRGHGAFLVDVHFWKHKNIRTKDLFKGQMCIQAGLVFICPLNICTCGDCLRLFCLGKNKGGCLLPFVSFKNAVLALQILCMMSMWLFRRKLLMHGLTDEHHLHSYVLLFFCLDYLFASCLWWNCFCGCILFKRQKNIRTKEFIECSKDRSIKLDVHLFIQCDTPLVLGLRLLLLERNEEVDA